MKFWWKVDVLAGFSHQGEIENSSTVTSLAKDSGDWNGFPL